MIKGAIFDMDGTIVDVTYDWKKIKKELQTGGEPILTYLENLDEPEKTEKWHILERYEEQATARAVLKEGMGKFLAFLKGKGIKKALVTNNSRKNVDFLLDKFKLSFDLVISREAGLWKPSGAPFLHVLENFGIHRKECCVVGDSHFDVKAAEEAGIERIFILADERGKTNSIGGKAVCSVEELQEEISKII
jgi:HAD superfamily hydrolase (TIGR01549 family)